MDGHARGGCRRVDAIPQPRRERRLGRLNGSAVTAQPRNGTITSRDAVLGDLGAELEAISPAPQEREVVFRFGSGCGLTWGLVWLAEW